MNQTPDGTPIVKDIVRAPFEFHRTWRDDPDLAGTAFRRPRPVDPADSLPSPEDWRAALPEPYWDGHPDVLACWRRAWEIAAGNLRLPAPGSGFTRRYAFMKFSGAVFAWGSCFTAMFGKYAAAAFPYIRMLENFYGVQDSDGFMPRELDVANGRSAFARDDPSSTGGNLFAWAEWQWYRFSGDRGRLAEVYPSLLAFHRWLRRHVEAVAEVFRRTGSIWESYSPTAVEPGKIYGQWVRNEFVGFSGIAPIAMFIEHVLGIRAAVDRIDWDVRIPEAHGIRRLRLGDGTVVDLECAARRSTAEPPRVTVRASRPISVYVNGKEAVVEKS